MLAILELNEIYELNGWIAYEAICQVQRMDDLAAIWLVAPGRRSRRGGEVAG